MKQGQHFRRAIADVLVRLAGGLPTGLPTGARIGAWSGTAPLHLDPRLPGPVVAPAHRRSTAFFTGVQLLPSRPLLPPSPPGRFGTNCAIVARRSPPPTARCESSSLTRGRPSGARCRVRHNNCNDHVAVPSCSQVGCRAPPSKCVRTPQGHTSEWSATVSALQRSQPLPIELADPTRHGITVLRPWLPRLPYMSSPAVTASRPFAWATWPAGSWSERLSCSNAGAHCP